MELEAEVLGFLLGFFGDVDCFIKNLWTLLNKLSTLPTKMDFIDKYIIRSFFVEMYFRLFLKSPPDPPEQFSDQSKAQEQLISHLRKIKATGYDLGESHEIEFFASYHAPTIASLYSVAVSLHKNIRKFESEKRTSFFPQHPDNDDNLNKIVDAIKNGRIWPYGIEYPEYLLYRLLKRVKN